MWLLKLGYQLRDSVSCVFRGLEIEIFILTIT